MTGPSRSRLLTLSALAVVLFVALIGRLWYVQVSTGAEYASLARSEQVRGIVIPSLRGQILDDTGRSLVTSRPALVVTVNVQRLAGGAEIGRLAALLG